MTKKNCLDGFAGGRSWAVRTGLLVCGWLLAGCSQTPRLSAGAPEIRDASDLYVVDCLLPGQVRQLGATQYMSARRPVRTTAQDCRIRGGEYVAYDRADYRTALNVWLPQAELGDAEAQNYVGEIFEKGLGQAPDYKSALHWYKKAAAQGNQRAQINLGYLHEKGLGVNPDIATALNWYRKASGLDQDELVLGSEARQTLEESREQLRKELASREVQTAYLQEQIAGLRAEAAEVQTPASAPVAASALNDAQQKIDALTALYQSAKTEGEQLSQQLQQMEVAYRSYSEQSFLAPADFSEPGERVLENINFGRYFALIIGNQDYVFLDDLRSPLRDAHKLKSVLESRYGFNVLLVPNGTEKSILNTINDFYDQIGEDDNLLIYYAGHGDISRSELSRTERGYWLPVDAGRDNISNWINNAVISDHLDRIRARSVLVISDSCFAGHLGSDKSPFLFGISGENESEAVIRAGLDRRARVVISSGGLRPVMDGSSTRHSVFASALLEALETNNKALRDSRLFAQLSVNVRKRSGFNQESQIPEMKPVREAGHEGGAFYFVPSEVR